MDRSAAALAPAAPARYTARVLAPDDWDQLYGLPISEGAGAPKPDSSAVVVVADSEGRIVATWAAITFLHLEGCWIAPEHRKDVGVVRALLAEMDEMLQHHQVTSVLTMTADPSVGALARKLGGVKLGDAWQIPIPFGGQ